MKKTLFIFLLLISVLNAQTKEYINQSDSSNVFPIIWNDVKLSVDNEISFFKRPFNFDSSDWLKTGIVSASTGLLFLSDKSVRTFVQDNLPTKQDGLIKIGDYYGQGIFPFGLGVGMYFTGLATKNIWIKKTGSTLMEALVASGITVTLLKVIIGRTRPFKNEGPYSYHPFQIKNIYNSLPSGHAIIAFTTSAVLAEKIDNIYATVGLYGLASLTAYQRMYSDNHWLSDTFLGAVLGIAIGKYFANLDNPKDRESVSKLNYNLFPIISKNINGLGINISF